MLIYYFLLKVLIPYFEIFTDTSNVCARAAEEQHALYHIPYLLDSFDCELLYVKR